jgi:hypothetical protein
LLFQANLSADGWQQTTEAW